ncbi:MAG: hypothetical protein CVU56_15425, partial [Deltaproteobacteria bacterium HGW-Deltaproteobacteria-14]
AGARAAGRRHRPRAARPAGGRPDRRSKAAPAPGDSPPAAAGESPADAPAKAATDGPKATSDSPAASDGPSAAAMARVAAVPEIGQCRREPLRAATQRDSSSDKPLTEDDLALQRERLEFQRAAERFRTVVEDYQSEVGLVLQRSFADREKHLGKRYDKQAEEIDLDLKQRRLDAIRRFERFIAKYPDDPLHTPDAMFRLAELYYERSAVDYADAQERYTEERELYERGKIPTEPQASQRDYSDSVKLYRQLLGRFGDQYRYADAVYYLLGYVLNESGEDIEARNVWLTMVEKHPKSEYAPEVYLRVGENHFDYGEFAEAAEVYKRALGYTDSPFYDKALYKLAWTYFQMYDYDRAIKTFKDLIGFYDTHREEAGGTASALREEAIDYLAKSLTEDDWDNDGIDDPNAGVGRALAYLSDGKPFENDIVAKYAESLYDLHDKKKYDESITVYRELIRRDPTALSAVQYQQQIIKIFDIKRDIDGATAERQRLAEMFAPGSPWAVANRGYQKQVNEATAAVENAMRRRALFLHQRAQELKAQAKLEGRPELLAESFDNYTKAAKAYDDYLAKYPSEPASYEMRFYLAETLYYSEQFTQAAAAYFEIASDPNQSRFREPSAWSAIKAHERILHDAVEADRLPAKADPNRAYDAGGGADDDNADVRHIAAEPYPQPVKEWMAAVDFYVLRDITRENSRKPQVAFAYQAADIAMRFNDYENARDRFRQVIACFPDDDLAADAMANILNTYRDENDLPSLEKWANIADKLSLGDPEQTAEIRKKIKVFKLGAQFQRAESLLAAGRHLEAAQEFERLADQNADLKFLDKAYYNSAMAYKEVRYYDSAARIFEKLVTDPRFRTSEFYNESLFELAENYKLFFNFDKAITTYQAYFQRTQGSDDANRPYALYTAARLQEYTGNAQLAAGTYERYADTFRSRPDAANALYRAADIHGEIAQRGEEKRVLGEFIKRYQTAQGMGTRVLEAMVKLGQIAMTERKTRDATKLYKDVIREYQVQGQQPGTAAAAAAAEATFALVEQTYERYVKLRLTGTNQRRMTADLAEKKKLLGELELAYGDVLPYKSLDWNIASFYRLGDIYREFATTLYKAPEPQGLSDEELDIFTTQIEDEALKYENVAIERFERTVQESLRLKVTNEWARKALEAINAYKPQDYPLFKETKQEPTFSPRFKLERRAPQGPPPARVEGQP